MMRETMRGAYTHTPFTFQKDVSLGVAGGQYANLKLTMVLEDSWHKWKKLVCLFTDFKETFIFFLIDLIMKTIDVLPIYPTVKGMWKKRQAEIMWDWS